MSPLALKTVAAAAFFLVIFVTGYWVSRSGTPVNAVRMNVHKLIGLAAGVFVALAIYRAGQESRLTPLEIGALATGILFALATVITGGLASLAKPILPARIIHKFAPYLTLLSTAATLALLLTRGG